MPILLPSFVAMQPPTYPQRLSVNAMRTHINLLIGSRPDVTVIWYVHVYKIGINNLSHSSIMLIVDMTTTRLGFMTTIEVNSTTPSRI